MSCNDNIFINPSYPMYYGIGHKCFDERVKKIVKDWTDKLMTNYYTKEETDIELEKIRKSFSDKILKTKVLAILDEWLENNPISGITSISINNSPISKDKNGNVNIDIVDFLNDVEYDQDNLSLTIKKNSNN